MKRLEGTYYMFPYYLVAKGVDARRDEVLTEITLRDFRYWERRGWVYGRDGACVYRPS